eukprot:scaffold19088_cov79-Isochrysis_galbana.AAC.1
MTRRRWPSRRGQRRDRAGSRAPCCSRPACSPTHPYRRVLRGLRAAAEGRAERRCGSGEGHRPRQGTQNNCPRRVASVPPSCGGRVGRCIDSDFMAGDARRRSGQGWHPDAYAGELEAGTMPVGIGMTSGSGAMPMGPGLELSHPMHGCSSGVASFVPPALPGQPAHSLRHYGDGMPGFGGSPFARGGRPGQAQQRGGPMGGRAPPTGRHFGARPGGFGIVSSPQHPASAGSMPAGSLGGGMAGYGVAIEEYPVGGEYGGMRPAEQAMGLPSWIMDAPEPSGNMDLGRAETGAA